MDTARVVILEAEDTTKAEIYVKDAFGKRITNIQIKLIDMLGTGVIQYVYEKKESKQMSVPYNISPEQHERLMAQAQQIGLLEMPIDNLLKTQAEAFQQASAAKNKMYGMPNALRDTREVADALLDYNVLALNSLLYALVLYHRDAPDRASRWADAHRLVTGQRAYEDQDREPYHRRDLAEWMSRLEFYVSRWSSGANMEPEELYPALATQIRRVALIYGVEYTGVVI